MVVKTMKDLKSLRENETSKLISREKANPSSKSIEILVGMGTCGLAAGAGETYNKINELLISKGLKNVNVVNVGCVGFCHSEPTVQITVYDKEPQIYGKVTENDVEELIETVIIKGETLDELYLTESFKKAVV